MNKKHQKFDEEEAQLANKIIISKTSKASVIIKELERDYKLFLEGHTSYVNSVAITSDNKYIISGSDDNTIRIWNLLKKRQETVLEGHTSYVNSIAITSDNKYIISGS